MRRIAIIMAGAALALSLAIPTMASVADAHGRGGHRGDRHGYSDGHYRHGHDYHRGGRCYGCDGPGSRCGRYGCDYAYPYYGCGYYGCGGYNGGYYGGGYGCNFDYPCGPPYEYNCSKYRGPDAKPPADSGCKYDQKCDCYYHSSQPPPEAGAQPGPDQGAQPAPDQGQQPPDQGQQPPDQGSPQPPPEQGGEQPRPY